MKREMLLEAIGGVNESLLAETEQRVHGVRQNLRWMALVPAAVIALAISVAAATGLISVPILDSKITEEETVSPIVFVDGSGIVEGGVMGYNVYMEIEAKDNAPETVETVYTMNLPKQWDYEFSFGEFIGSEDWFQSGWFLSTYKEIQLNQYTFDMAERNFGENYVDRLWSMPKNAQVKSEIVTMAGMEMLRVTIPAEGMDRLINADGETRLYWSDGEYIMRLEYPSELTDEEIIAMLSTLHEMP